jgi:Transposase
MRKSRFNESQIIGVLREHEAGSSTEEVCRRHGISQQTFYRRKAKYGGMDVSAARRAAATRLMTERGYSQRRACGKLYRLYRWSIDFVADTLSFGRRFRIYGKQPAIEPLPHCRQGRLLWLIGRIGVWIEKDSTEASPVDRKRPTAAIYVPAFDASSADSQSSTIRPRE